MGDRAETLLVQRMRNVHFQVALVMICVPEPLEPNVLFSQVFLWMPRKQSFVQITQKSDIISSATG